MARLCLTLGDIARTVRGTLVGHADVTVEGVTTDSRTKSGGALFVALRGDRFDGHDFATMAVQNGAKAVLVEKQIDGLMVPHILVKDALAALQALGAWRRKVFSGPVVAITGSSGKTTTRKMVHAILSERYLTHQPIRNFNNHIGVPLTLLGLEASHGAAVMELGCSDFGEIRALTRLVSPDAGLITNVGPAHLEKLGSLDGVAKAKGELFEEMGDKAKVLVNLDDPRVAALPTGAKGRVTYGTRKEADVRLVSREPAPRGQRVAIDVSGETVSAKLGVIGAHNAANALAAAALASAVGVDPAAIAQGLGRFVPEPGRLTVCEGDTGLTIIDDTYNANPASMRAALEALKESSGGRLTVAVLGDMRELGGERERAHVELGRFVSELGIDRLVTMGEGGKLIDRGARDAGMAKERRFFASDWDSASDLVLSWTDEVGTVLVKGSRAMQMERVTRRLSRGRK
jgi:UDP-N-acetylmuramoyl-tripeptide--D-alanyl-D-alanine ligase